MRIPVSKIDRAFPELDSFTDEQCERFMKRIRSSWDHRKHYPLVACLAVTGISLLLTLTLFFKYYRLILDSEDGIFDLPGIASVFTVFSLFLALCLPFMLGLFARDSLLLRQLKFAIRNKLDRIRCLGCKYLLIGQVVKNQTVSCPECGLTQHLDDLGVSEADLIPPD